MASVTTAPMHGKTVLITGASNGIGLAAAHALAAAGADLILLCRDARKGAAARDPIARTATNAELPDLVLANLESQTQIRRVADDIGSRYDRLDVLINNAGNVFSKREMTEDGIERTFALNHLASFLLTNLLLDLFKAAPQGRIVNVTSEIHAGKLDWDNLQSEKRHQFMSSYKATVDTRGSVPRGTRAYESFGSALDGPDREAGRRLTFITGCGLRQARP